MRLSFALTALALPGLVLSLADVPVHAGDTGLTYGPRPAYLIDKLPEGTLKEKLQSCAAQTPKRTDFSIGHRGAPLLFPEHTVESNVAAAQMGAGILECDVTFTKDLELVCRHAQNDLHTTTNILTTGLAATCITPFTPATGSTDATAECRTSEITLEEFRSLTPKMDSRDKTATTPEAYQDGTAPWRRPSQHPLCGGRAQHDPCGVHYAVSFPWRQVHPRTEGPRGQDALQRLHPGGLRAEAGR